MLVAAICFATMGLFVQLASRENATLADIVMFRGLVPTLGFGFWLIYCNHTLKTTHTKTHLWRNLFGLIAMWFSFYATTQLPLATAVTLMYTSPLFIAITLFIQEKNRSNILTLFAIASGFSGVIALLQPNLGDQAMIPCLIGLAGGAFAASAYWKVKTLGQLKEPEWRTVFYFSLTTALSGLLITTITPEPLIWVADPFSISVLYLLGVGLTGGAGNLALTYAYGAGCTWLSASLQYATILLSTGYGFWFLNQTLAGTTWLGMVLIISCGCLSTWVTYSRRKQQKDKPKPKKPFLD